MHPADIKAKIYKREHTLKSLSEHLGYGPTVLAGALRRPGCLSIKKRLSIFLGVKPYVLFPHEFSQEKHGLEQRAISIGVSKAGRAIHHG